METTIDGSRPLKKRVHPHKFALWVAMGSISMMFAGMTSAYMVRESQDNWRYVNIPSAFWYSTFVILLSSLTFHLGLKAFKARQIPKFRALLLSTFLLGIIFGLLQAYGFYQLITIPQAFRINGQVLPAAPVRMAGNPGESFILIIAGMHLVHILGGLVALLISFFRSFRTKIKVYNATGLEIVGGYWHFVDILWIYLFIFFLANQ